MAPSSLNRPNRVAWHRIGSKFSARGLGGLASEYVDRSGIGRSVNSKAHSATPSPDRYSTVCPVRDTRYAVAGAGNGNMAFRSNLFLPRESTASVLKLGWPAANSTRKNAEWNRRSCAYASAPHDSASKKGSNRPNMRAVSQRLIETRLYYNVLARHWLTHDTSRTLDGTVSGRASRSRPLRLLGHRGNHRSAQARSGLRFRPRAVAAAWYRQMRLSGSPPPASERRYLAPAVAIQPVRHRNPPDRIRRRPGRRVGDRQGSARSGRN